MDLDEVLSELGHFGKFQAFNYVLLSVAILFTGLFEAGFIFTAGDLEYRCYIPECDAPETSYQPIWLRHAVPYQHGVPSRCHRFEPNVTNYTYNSSDFCSLEQFDREEIVKCYQWVYDGPESTILREWNITCDENRWKLTLVGTVNNIGQFIGLPIAGFISDAIGRKTTLVVSMVLSCLLGLARSWAWNYEVFLFLEFLEPALGTGVYTSAFILGMELVGPRARVLAATFISSSYALGEALMGAIAWWLQDWRLILRTAYLPAFLCISYYWIVPESVRWLLTKGKNKQAGDIILAAAKTNGVTLSEDVLCRIKSFSQPPDGEAYMESLPLLLFGIMSVVSGFLALFFPETLNMKLPDTIEEAQNIGIKETSTSAETTST